MANHQEHLVLASFIKEAHQNLRLNTENLGFEAAWEIHCSQDDVLKKYATSMSLLATQHWQPNTQLMGAECRIEWVYSYCMQYFQNEGLKMKQRLFEEKKLASLLKNSDEVLKNTSENFISHCAVSEISETTMNDMLHLLDVGSCYNPFKKFSLFKVLPIDLAPSNHEVLKCDFLHLKVESESPDWWNGVPPESIESLPEQSFDVVVFSLLLEYFPLPELRFDCCSKAYQLLKPLGLLFIITPDSKHATANAPIMKKWRLALANLGFWRVEYKKLKHLHCMAFCKCTIKEMPRLWAEREVQKCCFSYKIEEPAKFMVIPQDLSIRDTVTEASLNTCSKNLPEETVQMFNELPY